MAKFFTPELVLIIALTLCIMSFHGLLLCVIDYNQQKTYFTLVLLIYAVYAVFFRCCSFIDICY